MRTKIAAFALVAGVVSHDIAETAAAYESQAARFAGAGGLEERRAAPNESLDAKEHVATEGNQAAHVAASGRHGADGARAEAADTASDGQKITLAKAMKLRQLKVSSPKDGGRRLGAHRGPRPGGARNFIARTREAVRDRLVADSASGDGKDRYSYGSGKGTNQGQGSEDWSSDIQLKLGYTQLGSQGENKRNKRKENGKYNQNKMTPLSDVVDPSSMVMYKREKNSDKDSKKVELEDQLDGETIAEALTRMQPALRPEVELKKKRSGRTSVDNGFPYRYPTIRYVPWEELTDDTKEIVGDFGYNKRSWNGMSHEIEGWAFADLSKGQQESALLLGIDENVWDCFINRECALDWFPA